MPDPPAEDGLPSMSTPQNLADASTASTKSKKHKKRKDKHRLEQDNEPTTSQAPPSTADISSAAPEGSAETSNAEVSKEKKKSKKRKRHSQAADEDSQTNEMLPSSAEGATGEESALLENGDGDATGVEVSQRKKKKAKKSKAKEQQNGEASTEQDGQANPEAPIAGSQPDASQTDAAAEKKKKRKGKKESKKHGADANANAEDADATIEGQDSSMAMEGAVESTQATGNEAEKKSKKKSRKSKGGQDAAPASQAATGEPASSTLPTTSTLGANAAPSTSFAPSMPAQQGDNDDFDMSDLPPPLSTPAGTNGAAPPSGQSRIEPSDPSSSATPADTQNGKGKKRKASEVALADPSQKVKPKPRKSAAAPEEAQAAEATQAEDVAASGNPAINGKKAAIAKATVQKSSAVAPSTPANVGDKGKGKGKAISVAPPGAEDEDSEHASDDDDLPSVTGSAPNSAKSARPGIRKRPSLPLVPNKRPNLAPSRNSTDKNEVLATKWLNPGQLSEQYDVFFLTGRFSKEEDAVIRHYLHHFQQREGMTDSELEAIIFAKTRATRDTYSQFWADLARSLTDRPLMSVFHHVKRMMAPTARMGTWTAEEDARLAAAVKQYGQSWEAVSNSVGRWSQDCRDRWRNYIQGGMDQRKAGTWTKEEEDRLRKVVKLVKQLQETMDVPLTQSGQSEEDEKKKEIFWTAVAKKFGPTRSRQQCRGKWLDNMANRVLTKEGKAVRWSKRDQFIFVQKIASLQPTQDSDIEFRLLSDPTWNHWSGHNLSKRWHHLSTRAKKDLQNPAASTEEVVKYLKDEQDRIPRAEVKRFMAKAPGEPESGEEDEDDDDELSPAEGVEESDGGEEVSPRQKRKTAKDISKRLKPGQEYRTSEFVESSDDEDGEEDAVAEPDDE